MATNIEEIFGPFSANAMSRFTESEYQMYLDLTAEEPVDQYTNITYVGSCLSELLHRKPMDYLEKILYGSDWGDVDEQPDIEAECGGALDEFIEEFKPQKTTSERSDEQE